jgi:biopolymer transport protein ExbB/TolQ
MEKCLCYVSQEECEERRKIMDAKEEKQDEKIINILLQLKSNQEFITSIQKFLWGMLGLFGTVLSGILIKFILS